MRRKKTMLTIEPRLIVLHRGVAHTLNGPLALIRGGLRVGVVHIAV